MEKTKVPQGNVDIKKCKLLKDGGMEVHYTVLETNGNESYCNSYVLESAKDVHPDLTGAFDELKPIMCRVFGFTSYLSMVESDSFEASLLQKEQARGFAEEIKQRIKVRAISMSGSGESEGVVLTANLQVMNGQIVAINTPRIRFATESFGFEEECEKIVTRIKDEVYKYLYEGKKAQLELFGQ